MKRRILALLVTLVISALVVAPALAAPPTILRVPLVDGPFPVQACGDWQAMVVGDTMITQQVFYDNAGKPIRWVNHDDEVWTFYHEGRDPATGIATATHYRVEGNVFDQNGQWTMMYMVHSGPMLKLVLPHVGPVYMEVGHTIIQFTGSGPVLGFEVLFAAGQTNWFSLQYVPELCALLA